MKKLESLHVAGENINSIGALEISSIDCRMLHIELLPDQFHSQICIQDK